MSQIYLIAKNSEFHKISWSKNEWFYINQEVFMRVSTDQLRMFREQDRDL